MSIAEKLTTIAENEQKVYEAGQKSEHDKFWDAFQANGERTKYNYGFFNDGWTLENFRPKYDMKPTNAGQMFANAAINASLPDILDECGVTLDFSGIGYVSTSSNSAIFAGSAFTQIGVVDLSNAYGTLNNTFNKCANLITIRELKVSSALTAYNNVFAYAVSLENLIISGEIAGNGFDLKSSVKLSDRSITIVIIALSDSTDGMTVTLSLTAVNAAFETADGAADGSTSDAWLALAAQKPNWTISLA